MKYGDSFVEALKLYMLLGEYSNIKLLKRVFIIILLTKINNIINNYHHKNRKLSILNQIMDIYGIS